MAKHSSSSVDSVDISGLEKEIAALKAEVSQLKKDLAAASKAKASGGEDPRLDKLIDHLIQRQFLSEKFCKKNNLK